MIPENLKALIVSNCKHYNHYARLSLTYQSDATNRVLMVEFRMTVETIASTLKMLGYEVEVAMETIESVSWYEKIITFVVINGETIFDDGDGDNAD